MKNDMDLLKKQLKGNIQKLIDIGDLKDAKQLVEQYKGINKDDIEVYSMDAVILIMENKFDEAENAIKEGLNVNQNDFDSLYNLAYVYEQKGEYNKALIYYKRARKLKYYESQIRIKIDEGIENILKNHEVELERECKENEIYRYLRKIESVLFIDFDLTNKVNDLGKRLDQYGINVDLAYTGKRPDTQFNDKDLVYRKMLSVTNINDLSEYINYYCYNVVHIFNVPQNIKMHLEQKCQVGVISNDDLLMDEVEDVLKSYSKVLKDKKFVLGNENGEDLTILLPTYNRPDSFNRTLTFFNNFKKCKPWIIVLDSSSDENKKINKNIVLNCSNRKISYYSFNSTTIVGNKLQFGYGKINTDYVVVCADDDFLVEEGLIKSIEILKKDNTLYSVKGKNFFFTKNTYKLLEYDFFEGFMGENLVNRLYSYVNGFACTLYYQVFRTYEFKKLHSYLNNNSNFPSNPVFGEYCFYFMVLITGKVKKINVDLNIRDKGNERECFVKNFPHAIIERNFNENYNMFITFLCEYCKSIGRDNNALKQNIEKIFENFLINFLQIPKQYIIIENNKFDLVQLEIGMKKSWVWPSNL